MCSLRLRLMATLQHHHFGRQQRLQCCQGDLQDHPAHADGVPGHHFPRLVCHSDWCYCSFPIAPVAAAAEGLQQSVYHSHITTVDERLQQSVYYSHITTVDERLQQSVYHPQVNVSILLSSHAAVRSPSLHRAQGDDDRYRMNLSVTD